MYSARHGFHHNPPCHPPYFDDGFLAHHHKPPSNIDNYGCLEWWVPNFVTAQPITHKQMGKVRLLTNVYRLTLGASLAQNPNNGQNG